MIGKGPRSDEYRELLQKYGAVYLSAIGGAAASISESVKKCDLVCYEDLGAESILKITIENFPVVVVIDSKGNNLYEQSM